MDTIDAQALMSTAAACLLEPLARAGTNREAQLWPRHMAQRILVADDDPSSLEGLRVLLAIWGYKVETASDGRIALQKVSAAEPEAVITDVVMPVMNGLELLGTLRIERPWMPVIILTGQGSLDTLLRARQQGAYAYLEKPVDVGRLKSVLASALAKPEEATTP